jgi:hypothetical protein
MIFCSLDANKNSYVELSDSGKVATQNKSKSADQRICYYN